MITDVVGNRAQAMLELALCLAVVAAAIGGMAIYVRRSLQARYHAGVIHCLRLIQNEGVKEDFPIKLSAQYEPYYTRNATTEEIKNGTVTGGFPHSSIDMMTNTTVSRRTPLPERGW